MNSLPFAWPGYDPDDPAHKAIMAYLSVDIQQSREAVRELLENIEAVDCGKMPDWERTGNAYCLQVFRDCVVIEEDYADEPGNRIEVPLPVFKTAVQAWLGAMR